MCMCVCMCRFLRLEGPAAQKTQLLDPSLEDIFSYIMYLLIYSVMSFRRKYEF